MTDGAESRIRVAADIGGTFTDLVLDSPAGRRTAKVLTTPRAPESGVFEALATVLKEGAAAPAEVAVFVHGTTLATNALIERKGARTAFLTTPGVPRHSGDGVREAVRAIRRLHGQAGAARAAPAPARGRRAGVRPRADPGPPRRGGSARDRRRMEGGGGRGGRRGIAPRLGSPRPRAGGSRGAVRGAAGRDRVPVERGLPGDPGVRALLDHLRERLRPPPHLRLPPSPPERPDRARDDLPLLPDDVGRRGDHGRERGPVSYPAGGVRSRRGRDPRRSRGPRVRADRSALPRHGRHHGEDLPHRERRPGAFQDLRGGPPVPGPQGKRPAGTRPGHRDGGDRRGRRLHRARRRDGPAPGGAGERRLRARPPRATGGAARGRR